MFQIVSTRFNAFQNTSGIQAVAHFKAYGNNSLLS